MKKIFTFLSLIVLSALLVACGTKTTASTSKTTKSTNPAITRPSSSKEGSITTAKSTIQNTTKPINTTQPSTDVEEEFVCNVDRSGIDEKDLIEIDYFATDDEYVEVRMACAYMQEHPNVVIENRYDIKADAQAAGKEYTSYLVELASTTGYIPDLMQLSNLISAAKGKLLYDYSNEYNNDPDTEHLFESAKTLGVYNGKRLGMANGQAIRGVMLNKTLLEKYNFNLRNYGFNSRTGEIWTVDDMIKLARDFTTAARTAEGNKYYYGVDGEYNQLGFDLYFPSVYSDKLTYWGVDKTTGLIDFTSENSKYIEVYQKEIDLLKEGTRPNLTAAEAAEEFGAAVSAETLFFELGRTLMYHSFTYNFFMLQEVEDYEIQFLPLPSIKEEGVTNKTFGETGPMGLSAKLKDDPVKAAVVYDFAKYVTWGEEGFLKRIEINLEQGTILPKFPVSDFETVWNRIREIYTDSESAYYIEGFDVVIDNLLNGSVELGLVKYHPGIATFKAKLTNLADLNKKKVLAGELTVAEMAKIWQDYANNLIIEEKAQLDNYTSDPE